MSRLHRHGKTLKNFTYTDKEIADDIYSAINSTQFLGVSVCFIIFINDILIIPQNDFFLNLNNNYYAVPFCFLFIF